MEVVVTDDGSADGTEEMVAEFARSVDFPVRFTTHPHAGFQLARCRNEGVAASVAPYLIFLDGDCVIPPDHVRDHWRRREPGVVRAGYCCWLSRDISERITERVVESGEYLNWVPPAERWRELEMLLKSWIYSRMKHPSRPKLVGANIGICREDCERVNGYDERFRGWGCEDDDFRMRLGQAGVRIETTLPWTRTFHLWHPPTDSRPDAWRDGANVGRFERGFRLTRCLDGLRKREPEGIALRLVGRPFRPDDAEQMIQSLNLTSSGRGKAEVEVLFLPGEGRFSGSADFNLLVMMDGDGDGYGEAGPAVRDAHAIVTDRDLGGTNGALRFRLREFSKALHAVV